LEVLTNLERGLCQVGDLGGTFVTKGNHVLLGNRQDWTFADLTIQVVFGAEFEEFLGLSVE
jgi:hypothetical protein